MRKASSTALNAADGARVGNIALKLWSIDTRVFLQVFRWFCEVKTTSIIILFYLLFLLSLHFYWWCKIIVDKTACASACTRLVTPITQAVIGSFTTTLSGKINGQFYLMSLMKQ